MSHHQKRDDPILIAELEALHNIQLIVLDLVMLPKQPNTTIGNEQPEDLLSPLIGQETITEEGSFDSLGPNGRILTAIKPSMTESNKFLAMRLDSMEIQPIFLPIEDVLLMIPPTSMEETAEVQLEEKEHAD